MRNIFTTTGKSQRRYPVPLYYWTNRPLRGDCLNSQIPFHTGLIKKWLLRKQYCVFGQKHISNTLILAYSRVESNSIKLLIIPGMVGALVKDATRHFSRKITWKVAAEYTVHWRSARVRLNPSEYIVPQLPLPRLRARCRVYLVYVDVINHVLQSLLTVYFIFVLT